MDGTVYQLGVTLNKLGGAVAEADGTVKIYWGGADTVMCVGEADLAELVALCLENGRPAK